MTGAIYYARANRWLTVMVLVVATGVAVYLFGYVNCTLNPLTHVDTTMASLLPLAPAIAIQTTLATGRLQADDSAARIMSRWRVAHVLILSSMCVIALVLAAIPLTTAQSMAPAAGIKQGAVTLARNTMAFTGAALAGSSVVAPRLAWVVPVTWVLVPPLLLTRSDSAEILLLPLQPDAAFDAFVAALILFCVGTVVATRQRVVRRWHRSD
ncbi:MAG TPA: hypothetical protein VFU07_03045 [Candidatus Lumbricidophila sp.]|nr:hypothetical protein [Candidatus Lumbricidophila sp.]